MLLIVDTTDGIGKVLAEDRLGVEAVHQMVEQHRSRGEVMTMVMASPRGESLAQMLATLSPSGDAFVRRGIPEGHFGVVTIARGGTLYGLLPIPSGFSSNKDVSP